jgi:osmotically-inducible protein OsmY
MMKACSIILIGAAAAALSACAPVILGSGTVIGTAAVSEKGVSGAFSDTQISTQIRAKLYSKDSDLYYKVGVTVTNGEVMLTGAVPNDTMQLDAVRLAWEVKGVQRVIDNICVSQDTNIGNFTQDSWISTRLHSSLLFDQDILSVNYSIKTMNGTVYLMGIAQNQDELNRVVNHARNTSNVKKVVSYVQIKGVAPPAAPAIDVPAKDPVAPVVVTHPPAAVAPVDESAVAAKPAKQEKEQDEQDETD